jgi:hypothetical protein
MGDSATGFQRKGRQLYSKAVTENFPTERESDGAESWATFCATTWTGSGGETIEDASPMYELHLCNSETSATK